MVFKKMACACRVTLCDLRIASRELREVCAEMADAVLLGHFNQVGHFNHADVVVIGCRTGSSIYKYAQDGDHP